MANFVQYLHCFNCHGGIMIHDGLAATEDYVYLVTGERRYSNPYGETIVFNNGHHVAIICNTCIEILQDRYCDPKSPNR